MTSLKRTKGIFPTAGAVTLGLMASTLAVRQATASSEGRIDGTSETTFETSVAALLNGRVRAPARSKVVAVLSGGNIDLDQMRGFTWN